jgi:hypothetical protein
VTRDMGENECVTRDMGENECVTRDMGENECVIRDRRAQNVIRETGAKRDAGIRCMKRKANTPTSARQGLHPSCIITPLILLVLRGLVHTVIVNSTII